MYNNGCGSTGSLASELRTSLMRATENLNSHQINALLRHAHGLGEQRTRDGHLSLVDLSGREMEVLRLLANGYTRRDIGATLGISFNTAARHIANIYGKLNVSSVAEATQYAYANRII